MAAPVATLTTLANALKRVYEPGAKDMLNNNTYLLQKLERDTRSFEGSRCVMAFKNARNLSTHAAADGAAMQAAGFQSYGQAFFTSKYLYSHFSISGPTIAAASKMGPGAFVNSLASEIEGTIKDAKDHQNFMMFSDGTGTLAKVVSSKLSSTFARVDNPRYFVERIGLTVDLVCATVGTVRYAGLVVSAVNLTTNVVTFTTSVSAINGQCFIRPGSWCNDLMGLKIHADTINVPSTALYEGLNRTLAASSIFCATVLSGVTANRAITLALMQSAMDTVKINTGNKPDLIVTTDAIVARYESIMEAQKRFVNRLTLDGGFDAVEFNRTAILTDKYATPNAMYFLTVGSYVMYEMEDWGWAEDIGGSILHKITGFDGYEATLRAYKEFACRQPNANAVIRMISET